MASDSIPRRVLKKRRRAQKNKPRYWLIAVLLIGTAGGAALFHEMETSTLQSREISRYAAGLTYQVEPGASDKIAFPSYGPFDQRLGYVALPNIQERLLQRGFTIRQQVRFSDELQRYAQYGLYVPYTEKVQAGLTLFDCRTEPVYQFRYPGNHYADFNAIPDLIVQSLLFIENRDLLSDKNPLVNPAVDWPRFFKAALTQVGKALDLDGQSAGGSTLATQVEKYRHSEDGLTYSPQEKIRQMVSASVRAYRLGANTLEARKLVVWAYLNSVPLSAAPGYGEVHGLGDGLWVWFAADPERVNQLLDTRLNQSVDLAEQGLALRQVVALMIAHRRPSYYLAVSGRSDLNTLTDSHIRLFYREKMISKSLMDAALNARLQFRDFVRQPAVTRINTNKGLLAAEKTADVRYSFTLFERTDEGFKVRVQTDNTNQPFDLNEGSKLELGSTAKLRVLTTYLEIIAKLHSKYHDLSVMELRRHLVEAQDTLSVWSLEWLLTSPKRDLATMLEAALEREYSADPKERFFTGGGIHTFNNFRKEDDERIVTMRDALRESINLPFVRLMKDIERYTLYSEGYRAQLMKDDKDPRRMEYLRQFADKEGRAYLLRFWRKYKDKTTDERMATLLEGLKPSADRLAAVHRYLLPEASVSEFVRFMDDKLPPITRDKLTNKQLEKLYNKYGRGKYSLPDQGYIARVHPLELWLLGYLNEHHQASFSDVVAASSDKRQEVYSWLFKTRHRNARDSRVRTMLEVEAFTDIHQSWQRLGYPFDHLVPSLATALGSSGDRPAALSELMGIILNDGVRVPTKRINHLHFAQDTPFETEFTPVETQGVRVLPVEVARALRGALSQVVDSGTARRISGVFKLPDGTPIVLGGKTGTGDNRLQTVNRAGTVVQSLARNRTATFVFYLGDRHFGTLTAYVAGSDSEKFTFTSALPVQVLKGMAPILSPYLAPNEQECRPTMNPSSTQ
ncbi:TPA: penicillin-binding protein [Vibrio cholerae]|nr:penicillin-binding protein [Vibrio cholerae]